MTVTAVRLLAALLFCTGALPAAAQGAPSYCPDSKKKAADRPDPPMVLLADSAAAAAAITPLLGPAEPDGRVPALALVGYRKDGTVERLDVVMRDGVQADTAAVAGALLPHLRPQAKCKDDFEHSLALAGGDAPLLSSAKVGVETPPRVLDSRGIQQALIRAVEEHLRQRNAAGAPRKWDQPL